ncbi:hypothetical protein N7492_000944 [Penicillium capsulatum]|uniref:50S ribosomal protein YmL27 n=1 Tax=Penicillium capsulatum TaxID=69766 RepID=A0A9W9IQJ2_9EURO|nr:hypothetical protein N7492_000944 [Penicillium capsulatum]KAJ6129999.1 hypothetical protein N7512_002779 [Penicillium capsulatum]
MFKPSQPMMARLRLTTKQVNGGYYKGTRTGSMGYFDKKGNYVIDWKKVRTYVVPDLENFKLSPFVTKRMPAKPTLYTKDIERNGRTVTVVDKLNGYDYLDLWELHNAGEVVEHEAQRELDAHYASLKEAGKEQ